MAKHLQLGHEGEDKARLFLQNLGYVFIQANWRYRRLEVDLLFHDGPVLVFVEVKSRSSSRYGDPHAFVDVFKQRRLMQAAGAYIAASHHHGEIRFDIVEVYMDGSGRVEHIKDAFWNS